MQLFFSVFLFFSIVLATEYTGVATLRHGKPTLISQICVDQDEWIMRNYTKIAVKLEWHVSPGTFLKYGFDIHSTHHVTLTYEAIAIPWIRFINPNSTKNTHFLKNNTIRVIDHNVSDCVDLFAVTNADHNARINLHYFFGAYWL